MNSTTQLSGILRGILTQPVGGIVGLVDDLLVVCLEHSLQLEWQAGRCRFRPCGGNWEELPDVALRKSVFRAVLARVATLCNERTPNSVSPYGGQGELSAADEPEAVFRATFVNTPAEQQLELIAPPGRSAETDQQRRLTEAYRQLALKYDPDALRSHSGSDFSSN